MVLYLAVAAVAKIAPFPGPKPTPTVHHTPKPAPTHKATPNPLAPGVAPLVELLPADVNPANCTPKPKTPYATPGLVTSLACYDSGISSKGDSIYAYQMNSFANYQMSVSNGNTWWGYKPSSGSGCPPSGGNTFGSVPWFNSKWFPTAAGQTLECGYIYNSNNQPEPVYVWNFPSEDAFIVAVGDPNSTFSALQTWWTNNSAPAAAPKPATP